MNRIEPMPFGQAPLDINELIARIKAEAALVEGTAAPSAQPLAPPALSIPRLLEEPGARSHYQLGDFLCLQDTDQFLNNAYRALLGREPDEEGARNYGDYLRSGGSRLFVLYALKYSAEGRARAVSVDGMPWGWLFGSMPAKRLLIPLLRRAEGAYLRRHPEVLARHETDRLRRQLDEAHAGLLRWAAGIAQRGSAIESQAAQMQSQIDRRLHTLEIGTDEARRDARQLADEVRQETGRLADEARHLGDRAVALDNATAELRGGAEWLQQQIDGLSAQGAGLREIGERASQALSDEMAKRQRLVKDIDFIRSDLIYHRTQVRDLMAQLARLGAAPPAVGVPEAAALAPLPERSVARGLTEAGLARGPAGVKTAPDRDIDFTSTPRAEWTPTTWRSRRSFAALRKRSVQRRRAISPISVQPVRVGMPIRSSTWAAAEASGLGF